MLIALYPTVGRLLAGENVIQAFNRYARNASNAADEVGSTHAVVAPVRLDTGSPPCSGAIEADIGSPAVAARVRQCLLKYDLVIVVGRGSQVANLARLLMKDVELPSGIETAEVAHMTATLLEFDSNPPAGRRVARKSRTAALQVA